MSTQDGSTNFSFDFDTCKDLDFNFDCDFDFGNDGTLNDLNQFTTDASEDLGGDVTPTRATGSWSYDPSRWTLVPSAVPIHTAASTTPEGSSYGAPQELQPITNPNPPLLHSNTPYRHLCWHESIGWYYMSAPTRPNTFQSHIVGFYERAPVPSKFRTVSTKDELNTNYVSQDLDLPPQTIAPIPRMPTYLPPQPTTFQSPQPPQPLLTQNSDPQPSTHKRKCPFPEPTLQPAPKRRQPKDRDCTEECRANIASANREHIPRPRNAFICFRSDYSKANSELKNHQHVSLRAGLAWKQAPDDVKERYHQQAAAEAKEHRRKYPGYKFNPTKKSCICGNMVGYKEKKVRGGLRREDGDEDEEDELDLDDYAHPAVRFRKAPIAPTEARPLRRSTRLESKGPQQEVRAVDDEDDEDDDEFE
ncbi:hypothetical protein MBLNU230_g7472t1 [Neophaeotheca triangularis]